jgi:hypothetical protein
MVNPWKTYVKLSAVLMGSHGLTKGSLAFLNYPAQLMFKSTKVTSKLIPCPFFVAKDQVSFSFKSNQILAGPRLLTFVIMEIK